MLRIFENLTSADLKVMKVREELKRTNAVVAEIHKEAQVHELTVSASPQLRSNVRES